ncbi:hypothetical protein TNCV_4243091 [Trichonephila clavipes]|nr:hypothetical protein TNCV_4243091 [Trichonephila clavipes]
MVLKATDNDRRHVALSPRGISRASIRPLPISASVNSPRRESRCTLNLSWFKCPPVGVEVSNEDIMSGVVLVTC